ncbi:MAG: hypothetical protein R3C68_17960 [Myxococcota bacterium]
MDREVSKAVIDKVIELNPRLGERQGGPDKLFTGEAIILPTPAELREALSSSPTPIVFLDGPFGALGFGCGGKNEQGMVPSGHRATLEAIEPRNAPRMHLIDRRIRRAAPRSQSVPPPEDALASTPAGAPKDKEAPFPAAAKRFSGR